ncbi:MAG: saccharopine dehydrogenase NADP-binding domain-containing protein [Nitrospira sp.]|nr:saccharopine dehydrogenase NADP-binding domain-containing protein [Nitrospira sp.]
MRIFVLGVGAAGSFLVKLLLRQGHHVTCGDRDPERARRFLGDSVPVAVEQVNGRNRWSVIKACRGAQLIVNMLPSVCNRTVIRAALHVRVHYLDTAAHLTASPFRAEQIRFARRFLEKRRSAVITAGVAPGLTNLLVAAAADRLDTVETVRVRLYEATDSRQPVSQWSADVSFDEAVSPPCVYRDGRYALARRFGERELFRFPVPIGVVPVMLAAQDEVATIPHCIALRSMDVKIGGPDIDRMRRWYRQGKLRKSQGPVAARFPRTPTPDVVEQLIAARVLRNARFAAAVVVEGIKNGHR